MSSQHRNLPPRLEELLLDQAICGLDGAENRELESLRADAGVTGNPFMETAALVQLGLASMAANRSRPGPMPESLRRKLLAGAPGSKASGGS